MRVIQINYTRTKQVGRFEPEKIELLVELAEGDSTQEAIARARRTVANAFGETMKPDEVQALESQLAEAKAEKFE